MRAEMNMYEAQLDNKQLESDCLEKQSKQLREMYLKQKKKCPVKKYVGLTVQNVSISCLNISYHLL